MKIKNIQIKNFKSIKEMDLPFKDLNILIGPNGAGKSNFISFFSFFNALLEGKKDLEIYVDKQDGADNLLYFGKKYSSELFLRVDFDDVQYYSSKLKPSEKGDRLVPVHIEKSIHDDTISDKKGGLKDTDVPDLLTDGTIDKYIKKAFAMAKVYHFHDTGSSAGIKRKCSIDDNRYLKPDGYNLPAFLYFLKEKHEKYFERIQDTIRLVAPFFLRFDLVPDKRNENLIQLVWKHINYEDITFTADHLSDGTLRMMCLATLLLQPELPDVILIDEPELGLHPSAITILSSLLEIVSKKSQVIVSTQSVTLIDHFAPEDIVVVDYEDNQSKFRRPGEKELDVWLEDQSLGEIWEKNIIGGRP